MKQEKMIKSATNLDRFASVMGSVFLVFGILCFVFSLALLLFKTDMVVESSITLGFVKLYFSDKVTMDMQFMKYYLMLGLCMVAIFCFIIFYAIKLVRNILSTIKKGRPFEENVPQILRKIAWIVLGGGLLIQIVNICESMLITKAVPFDQLIVAEAVSKIEYMYTMDFSFVFIAMTLFFLSYVFAYGVSLQIESDETL